MIYEIEFFYYLLFGKILEFIICFLFIKIIVMFLFYLLRWIIGDNCGYFSDLIFIEIRIIVVFLILLNCYFLFILKVILGFIFF